MSETKFLRFLAFDAVDSFVNNPQQFCFINFPRDTGCPEVRRPILVHSLNENIICTRFALCVFSSFLWSWNRLIHIHLLLQMILYLFVTRLCWICSPSPPWKQIVSFISHAPGPPLRGWPASFFCLGGRR